MADTNEGTQNGGAGAADESSSNSSSSTNQGTQSNQPANAGTSVDGTGAEGNRNSDGSDGQNGGDGDDGGRGRASRADRRFSDLTTKIKDLERDGQGKDDMIRQLQAAKVDPSKLKMPELAPGTELTNEQWQKDVVSAAEQLVDVKVGALAEAMTNSLSRRDGAGTAVREIEAAKSKWKVLDPTNDEHYNPEMDEAIGNSYFEVFKANPSYSFAAHLKAFEPALKAAETASDGTTSDNRNSRGQFANRSNAASRRNQKAPEDMNLDELETYIHSQNS